MTRYPDDLNVTRLADVAPEAVQWAWPGRLPLGKLTVLDGDPGDGKSTLALDLAARLTTATPMPGETVAHLTASDVLLLSAEDGAGDTLRPRFDAAGGDPNRVHLFEGIWTPVDDERGDDWTETAITLPDHLRQVEALVKATGAKLVIVDVLAAYLSSSTDSYRDQDVRSMMRPLARLAETTGTAVVLIRHLSKSGGARAVYRGGGSIGIIGAARVGLLVARDPDDEARRILAVTKCNVALEAESMAYRLIEDAEHACGRIAWEGTTRHRASDLLTESEDRDREPDATDVLAELLADGPMVASKAQKQMRDAGYTAKQTRTAREKLGIRPTKVGAPGDQDSYWVWSLPGTKVPEGDQHARSRERAGSAPSGGPGAPSLRLIDTESDDDG